MGWWILWREEKKKRKKGKHGAETVWCCRREAVAYWLPGNDKGDDMARARGEIEEGPDATGLHRKMYV